MKCPRSTRRALVLAFAAAFATPWAAAQEWPAKPITLVVPFPPGGTTDVLARALGEKLQAALGQPVVIENKPGAGATLGADIVAKARPDGYTLLMGAVHHTIATSVYKKLPYGFEKDFAPITMVALVPNVWTVSADAPANDVKSMVALAKAAKAPMTYGSNGMGTAQHLIGTQVAAMTGIELVHVPYKGSGPLTTDLIGGQLNMSFDTLTPVLPHIKAGKLKALAVTTAKRSSTLPHVPTLEEAGLKGFDLGTWFGVLAPAATPKEVVARLNTEMVKIIQTADFRQRMLEIGAEPIGNSAADMGRRIAADTARYAKLVKDAKVTLE
ncbi:tripartite tricarboxylate transporter substrate binding protein [Ideonella sp. BN130291]|uniref:tripartite tricarboxylate transporter substrate binding protein n=1 Tax=Ideonella sp. BN130291 TaxID=3112940 RepID=UPI002E26CD93|nr:tripartite tricarboxylate transporter substrate binding protein [Ideonella sp. BN130291]